jgi:hypothetical protein
MLAIGRRKEPCYRTINVCTITERAEGMSDDSVLQHNSRGDFIPPKRNGLVISTVSNTGVRRGFSRRGQTMTMPSIQFPKG